jgi:hypothetical protein
LSEGIKFVCSDSRFHIVAKMNEALDDVRAAEARRLVQDGYEPILKKTRWCVLKRKANLTSLQRFRLRDLLRYNLKTVRAYLFKEDFQQFWEYHSPTWAAKFLDDWCQQVMRSRIEPMKKVAKTLLGHRELILNYFRAKKQFSSGVIEGRAEPSPDTIVVIGLTEQAPVQVPCRVHTKVPQEGAVWANSAAPGNQKSGDSRQAVGSVAIEARVLMKSHLSSRSPL